MFSRSAFGVWLVFFSCVVCAAARTQPSPEADIKANFLLRFADFVQWPSPAADPLVVCLSDGHPFGNTVAALAAEARVRGRRIFVRKLTAPDDVACQIAYVDATQLDRLHTLRRHPVLTVGDTPDFCARGGVINFRTQRGRVRFEIGLSNARRVGLLLDTQLLRLASTVYEGGR